MLAFWWLASLTLIATFTGSLVALFAVDKTNMPFETLEQMVRQVQRGQYRVVMDQNSQSRTQMIARSDIQTYKDLWHEMKINNRSVFVDGLESGVRYVKQNKGSVLLGPMDALQTLSFIDCDVVVLSQGILPTYMSIPFKKGSMYSTFFSDRIRQLVERGFIDKWLNDYKAYQASQQRMRCNSTAYSTTKGYLDLDRAQGAFWVLLAGVFLSVSGLFSEYILRAVKYMFTGGSFKPLQKQVKQNGTTQHNNHPERSVKTLTTTNGHVGNGFTPTGDAEARFNTNGYDVGSSVDSTT
uniref:Ionotropic glutamate receptor C-terminal domain-containing protein n=1 Tax=Plectus sambesii TaxID=2011161 RepID=A0A914UQK3_9BILA